ncbi:hypothetical protein [Chryseobacterium gambrini]|uniref:hypothetical protein n=1 Tax=Chryseobacterium gambrini TaxID=373672 RepID=UPI0022F150AA|nr:hypothetical protein [Chryseobacterium gambrini]WBV52823.1 hypothetical protein PFY09_00620 [Chryseobacterium gambrini]
MKKYFLSALFFISVLISNVYFGQNHISNSSSVIKENLDYPFGTLVKLKVEIVDGTDLKLKAMEGRYLINIIEVNDIPVDKPFIMEFIDDSGEFPTEDFSLYKKLYKIEAEHDFSLDDIKKMQKDYVGKTFIVLAYETGKFVGIPNESDYVRKKVNLPRLMRQDVSFQFKNYIVIDSKLKY